MPLNPTMPQRRSNDMPAGRERRAAPRLACLQAGRGLAAGLVICAHNSTSIFSRPKYFASNPVGHWLDWTHVGVEFFFVLSGFIIGEVHADDIGRPQRIGHFLKKRFLRIYPVYWVLLACLLCLYFLHPQFGDGFERRPAYIVNAALLIDWVPLSPAPARQPVSILPVAWTLYHEILFYAFFVTLLIRRRLGLALFAAWFAACAANLLAGPFDGLAGLYIAPRNLIFGMGLLAAYILRHHRIPRPALCLAAGLLLFFAAAIQEVTPHLLNPPMQSLACGAGAMLAVLGMIELERSRRLVTPRVLVLLGDASYAIYLVHLPVLILLAKLVSDLHWQAKLPLVVWYAAFAAVALAAGWALHMAVERPLLKLFRTRAAGAGLEPPAFRRRASDAAV